MRSSIGRLALSSGEAYDNRHVFTLLSSPKYGTMFRTIAEMTPIGSGRLPVVTARGPSVSAGCFRAAGEGRLRFITLAAPGRSRPRRLSASNYFLLRLSG